MLSPKKVKWRKQQKGRMKGAATEEIKLLLVNLQFKLLSVDISLTVKLKLPVLRFQEKLKGVGTSGLRFFQISH
jgi:ribosomal protein L16/L10AE